MKQQCIYDFIAIGLGPFNLGLACLAQPIPELKCLFLEQRSHFNWHPGMLLADAMMQTPFLNDLVTMAQPTSEFSFLNYLKEKGRLYSFCIAEKHYVSRQEYNDYCNWAAGLLRNIYFMQEVKLIEYDEELKLYLIKVFDLQNEKTTTFQARRIVIGIGTRAYQPCPVTDNDKNIVHTSQYNFAKKHLKSNKVITIIGSGQSAAEVFYDLLCDDDSSHRQLNWITRSPQFFPLDLSKLTLEMSSPDYADYFYGLSNTQKTALLKTQKPLYKGISNGLIDNIYRRLYEYSISRRSNVKLQCNLEFKSIKKTPDAQHGYELIFRQMEQGRDLSLASDAVIFGTGYEYYEPAFLKPIRNRIQYLSSGLYDVDRFYSIDGGRGEIFVQNAEFHSHGLIAPDLGMGCYRNACILNQICGRIVYPIKMKTTFQDFGVEETVLCK